MKAQLFCQVGVYHQFLLPETHLHVYVIPLGGT